MIPIDWSTIDSDGPRDEEVASQVVKLEESESMDPDSSLVDTDVQDVKP